MTNLPTVTSNALFKKKSIIICISPKVTLYYSYLVNIYYFGFALFLFSLFRQQAKQMFWPAETREAFCYLACPHGYKWGGQNKRSTYQYNVNLSTTVSTKANNTHECSRRRFSEVYVIF